MKLQIHWPVGIDTSVFLREYWQKKPLLIRGAFENFKNPLSPDELAGLACEEEVASRIIREESRDEWTVEHGPFNDSTFNTLGESGWSLLVSDIEKHMPEFIQFIEPFRFIPDWRIDDLMISYAPIGSSVGPHSDNYDVFLLQADGLREWQIGSTTSTGNEFLPELDIKILSNFTPTQKYTLKSGDLLYLPPGLAHHGVSQDMHCMTWSFGFRAPSVAAMIEGFAHFLAKQISDELMYEDRNLDLQTNPGEITRESQRKLMNLLRENLITDETVFARWIGRFLTESGTSYEMLGDGIEFAQQLEHAPEFTRCTQSKLAYISGNSSCTLFVNGEAYLTQPDLAKFLCGAYQYSTDELKVFYSDQSNKSLLNTLSQLEVLIPVDCTQTA